MNIATLVVDRIQNMDPVRRTTVHRNNRAGPRPQAITAPKPRMRAGNLRKAIGTPSRLRTMVRPNVFNITVPNVIMTRHKAMPRDHTIMPPAPVIKQDFGPSVRAMPRKGGRPSREAAAMLGDKILDVATDLFLRDGYGAVSIEMVARKAGVSKRTLYQRFANKAVLFTQVVHRIIERLRPIDDTSLFEGNDLTKVLKRVAATILDAALTPNAIALYRIMVAEGGRFPDLALAVAKESAGPEAISRIGALLKREAAAGRITIKNSNFVAAQFLYMIIAIPHRRALGMGKPFSPAERAEWVNDTVHLFLNGCGAAQP
jgi:TetR/AcrR family transcriptional repressor of mexJK operon